MTSSDSHTTIASFGQDSLAEHACAVAGIGVFVLNQNGSIPIATSEMRRLLGIKDDQVLTLDSLITYVSDSDQEEVRSTLESAVALGQEVDLRFRTHEATEQRFLACVSTTPPEGTTALRITIRDITEESLDRIELVNQRRELEISQSISKVGSWKWFPEQDRSEWSKEMSRMFGLPPGQAPNGMQQFLDMIHPEDVPGFEKAAQELMTEKKNVTFQFRQKRLGDERYFALAANAPVVDVRGQTVVRGVTQDITESVRNQNMIRSQAEHIAHSNQELNRLNTYLRDFTQLASHDLRSPLNNMEVLLGMLAQRAQFDSGAEVVHEKLKHAIGTMQQSLSTFTTILEMQGNDGLEFENLFLPNLVRSSWETLTANLPDEATELSLDFSAWEKVRFPRYQMLSVIQNFLSNAIKYRKPNDSLVMKVRSEWQEQAPVLVFQDNGRGMDLPSMQHRLFRMNERFHPDVEGKGVGLHLIYTLVRAHGGNIEVESAPDQGTTFRVRLASTQTEEA